MHGNGCLLALASPRGLPTGRGFIRPRLAYFIAPVASRGLKPAARVYLFGAPRGLKPAGGASRSVGTSSGPLVIRLRRLSAGQAGCHAQAGGAGMLLCLGINMAALRLAMAPEPSSWNS